MSFPPLYKLLHWIPVEKLEMRELSEQPEAVEFLRENPEYIDWQTITSNSAAVSIMENNIDKIDFSWLSCQAHGIHLLKKYKERINWHDFSVNPAGISLIEENLDKVDWAMLSQNENAIHILENNLDKINWECLCQSNDNCISFIEKHIDKIHWDVLSSKEYALHLLKSRPDKIDYRRLSYNRNPQVIPMLFDNMSKIEMDWFCERSEPEVLEYIEKNFLNIIWNMERNTSVYEHRRTLQSIGRNKHLFYMVEEYIDDILRALINKDALWSSLCENENERAIELLKSNQNKIDWKKLSGNPGIFELDTQKMKSRCSPFAQELAAYVYSPSRLMRLCEKYDIEMTTLLEIFE